MVYKDDELTLEELKEVTASIIDGKVDEMLDKLSKEELEQFRKNIKPEKELTEEELDNVRAGIPLEAIESFKGKN